MRSRQQILKLLGFGMNLFITAVLAADPASPHQENNGYDESISENMCVSLAEYDSDRVKFEDFLTKIKELDSLIKEDTLDSYRLQVKKLIESQLWPISKKLKLALLAKHKISSSGFDKLTSPSGVFQSDAEAPGGVAYGIGGMYGTGGMYGAGGNPYYSGGYNSYPAQGASVTHQTQVENDYCLLAKKELQKNALRLYEVIEKDLEARAQELLKSQKENKIPADIFISSHFWQKGPAGFSSSNNYKKSEWSDIPETPEETEYWKAVGENRESFIYGGANPYDLRPAQIHAVRYYTGSGSSYLNTALRLGGSDLAKPQTQARIKMLNSALNKIPNYVGPVNRGATLPQTVRNAHAVGQTVTYPAYTSTSMANGFGGYDRFVIYSKTGKDISPYSGFQGEREILIPAGAKFKIIDRRQNDGQWQYVMVEVP